MDRGRSSDGERRRKERSPEERRGKDRFNEDRRRRGSRSNSPVQRRSRDHRDHVQSKTERHEMRQYEQHRQDRVRGDGEDRHGDELRIRRERGARVYEQTEQGDRGGTGERTNPSRPGPRQDGSRQRKRRRWERSEEEEDIGQYEFGGRSSQAPKTDGDESKTTEEAKPNYELSGKLTAETNTYKGVVIKYNEPSEAKIPKTRWRLYGFKGDETLPTLYIHRQSAYLIGRNRTIVDMPIDHPSCSGQHAVLQYRLVDYDKEDGTTGKKVKPYIIDLESTNGTYVNNNRIETARFYELKEGDMIKFGFSSREYVLLHENSKQQESVNEDKNS